MRQFKRGDKVVLNVDIVRNHNKGDKYTILSKESSNFYFLKKRKLKLKYLLDNWPTFHASFMDLEKERDYSIII